MKDKKYITKVVKVLVGYNPDDKDNTDDYGKYKLRFRRGVSDEEFCDGVEVDRELKLEVITQNEYYKQLEIAYSHIVRESLVDLSTLKDSERRHKIRKFKYLANREAMQRFIVGKPKSNKA